MKKVRKKKDIDFIFASSSINVRENRSPLRDTISRVAAAETYADAMKIFTESGLDDGSGDFMTSLDRQSDDMYAFLREVTDSNSEPIIAYMNARKEVLELKTAVKTQVFAEEKPTPTGEREALLASMAAKGDFSKRIPVTSDDEIGELAVSFNQMTNSLVQLEGMRKSFVANVSHELKTPMTTIGGFIDGILDGTIEPEKQSYYLQIVSDEVRRLSRLVQSMLSMAKLESGEFVLKPELFDFRELLCTIVISQEQRIEAEKIEITGLDGIEKGLQSPEAVNVNLYKAEKSLTDTLQKLPDTLEEAKTLAAASPFMKEILGESLNDILGL